MESEGLALSCFQAGLVFMTLLQVQIVVLRNEGEDANTMRRHWSTSILNR